MAYIVFGVPGRGKTRNANTLRRFLDCRTVQAGWCPGDPITADLVLTSANPMTAGPVGPRHTWIEYGLAMFYVKKNCAWVEDRP